MKQLILNYFLNNFLPKLFNLLLTIKIKISRFKYKIAQLISHPMVAKLFPRFYLIQLAITHPTMGLQSIIPYPIEIHGNGVIDFDGLLYQLEMREGLPLVVLGYTELSEIDFIHYASIFNSKKGGQ